MKTNILLLGGFGFLGTNLIKYIESHCPEKYSVIVMDRFSSHPAGISFTIVDKVYDGDFADRHLIDRIFDENDINLVIHSLSSTTPSSASSNDFDMRQNVLPTMQLLDVMYRHNVKSIVFLSSGGAVYGDLPCSDKGHIETDALYPKSSYGLSKAAIEKNLFQYSELFGFNVLILRPSNPYGPYHYSKKQGIINIAIEKALHHETFEVWGDGNGKKDYLYVDDLSEVMIRLIGKGLSSFQIVNVGSGELLSVNEILSTVKAVADTSFSWQYKEARQSDVLSFKLNLNHLFSLLPVFQPMPFQEGIEKTLLWYKSLKQEN